MPLRLFNTLTGQIDTLVPEGGPALRMYACGPTVYDYGHIGNFRTFLQIDVLRRTLLLLGIPLQAPDQPATVIEVECDAEPVIDHEPPPAPTGPATRSASVSALVDGRTRQNRCLADPKIS